MIKSIICILTSDFIGAKILSIDNLLNQKTNYEPSTTHRQPHSGRSIPLFTPYRYPTNRFAPEMPARNLINKIWRQPLLIYKNFFQRRKSPPYKPILQIQNPWLETPYPQNGEKGCIIQKNFGGKNVKSQICQLVNESRPVVLGFFVIPLCLRPINRDRDRNRYG